MQKLKVLIERYPDHAQDFLTKRNSTAVSADADYADTQTKPLTPLGKSMARQEVDDERPADSTGAVRQNRRRAEGVHRR